MHARIILGTHFHHDGRVAFVELRRVGIEVDGQEHAAERRNGGDTTGRANLPGGVGSPNNAYAILGTDRFS